MSPVWSEWSYSACSATCGEATKTAQRTCLQGICSGDMSKTEKCQLDLCPGTFNVLLPFSALLTCTGNNGIPNASKDLLLFLEGDPLKENIMCKRPIDVYMPVKTAINQECFKLGQLPTRDTILNGEFKGDLEECAFTCRFYSLCQGFSFNKTNGICYLQSRFSYSEISQAQGMISGPKQPCGTNNEQKRLLNRSFHSEFL